MEVQREERPLVARDVVLLISSLILQIQTGSLYYSFGSILIAIEEKWPHASRPLCAAVGSTQDSLFCFCSLVGALLIKRIGLKTCLALGSVLMPLCLIASAFVPTVTALVFTLGAGGGLSLGVVFMPAMTAVQWQFTGTRHRATAAAVASMGMPIGMLIASPILNSSYRVVGWTNTMLSWAGVQAGVYLVASGMLTLSLSPRENESETRQDHERHKKIVKLHRDPVFYHAFFAYACYFFSSMVPYAYFPVMADECGVPLHQVVVTMGVGALVGRPAMGKVADMKGIGTARVTVITMMFGGIVLASTVPLAKFSSVGLLVASAAYSISHSGRAATMPTLMSDLFDVDRMALAYGYINIGMFATSLFGLPVVALVARSSGFGMAFLLAGAIMMVASGLTFRAYSMKEKQQARDRDADIKYILLEE